LGADTADPNKKIKEDNDRFDDGRNEKKRKEFWLRGLAAHQSRPYCRFATFW